MLVSWIMKKLLMIVTMGLMLGGCSKSPEKIIEKCADKEFDYFPSAELRKEKFIKNNKFVKLQKFKQEYEKRKKIAESEFKDFAFQNFAINDDDMRETTNIIVINSLNSNKKDYQPKKFPRYIYEIKVKDKSKDVELVNKIEKLFNDYQEIYTTRWENQEEYYEHTTNLFYKLKLKDKLIDKKYERFFKKCEYLRNRSPLAFDAKWK